MKLVGKISEGELIIGEQRFCRLMRKGQTDGVSHEINIGQMAPQLQLQLDLCPF